MTLPSSTTSTAGSVTLEPTSPASVSTVRTSSTAAFSCLPPQRTIAYTENSLSALCGLSLVRAPHRSAPVRMPDQNDTRGPPALAHGWPRAPPPGSILVGPRLVRGRADLALIAVGARGRRLRCAAAGLLAVLAGLGLAALLRRPAIAPAAAAAGAVDEVERNDHTTTVAAFARLG